MSPKLQRIVLSLALFLTATLAIVLPWVFDDVFFDNIVLFAWGLITVLFFSFLILFVQLEMKIHSVLLEHRNTIHRLHLWRWEWSVHQLAETLRKGSTPPKEQIEAMETVRSMISDVVSLPVWTIQKESILFLIGSVIMPVAVSIFALL